jgi:hypothetical protein
MFLRIKQQKKPVVKHVRNGRVENNNNTSSNILSHIVRRYAKGNGNIVLPHCSGGLAFAKALQNKGIKALA